jgi:Uma2 family endonuclease
MATLVMDRGLEDQLRAERAASGADRFDEVWQGVLVIAPLADNEHQFLGLELASIVRAVVVDADSGLVYQAVNVSDRQEGWRENFRIPDVAVFLKGGPATDCGTHWCGGFDFGIEIITPGERTRDKLPFYSQLGVRELLLVDRNPWALELYRVQAGRLELAGRSTPDQPSPLTSDVLPLSFCLRANGGRPLMEVMHKDGVQGWLV